jgi:hypothetical protein
LPPGAVSVSCADNSLSFSFGRLGLEPLSAAEERELLAYHELGHATACYLLGRPITLVSLVPTRTWDGVCFHRAERVRLDGDLTRPLLMLPWRLRSAIEREIVIALAGPAAEELSRRRPSGYYEEGADEQVARRMAMSATLTSRERELLASGDSDETIESDLETSVRLSRALAAQREEAIALLCWLQSATRAIVVSPRFERLVRALVPQLVEQGSPGGRKVRNLLRAADTRARST